MKETTSLLSMLLIFSVGCKPSVWQKEPASFLGIKLGEPLHASMRECQSPDPGTHPCFDRVTLDVENIERFLRVAVGVDEDGVGIVSAYFGKDYGDLVREELIKSYGRPGDETNVFGTAITTWKGKAKTLTLQTGKGELGTVTIQRNNYRPLKPPPDKNPFDQR